MEDPQTEIPGLPPKKKPAPKKRNRPSRAAEPTGVVHPREMTKIRDRVGDVRDMAATGVATGVEGAVRILAELNDIYATIDRLDLRFKIHHDPSTQKAKK